MQTFFCPPIYEYDCRMTKVIICFILLVSIFFPISSQAQETWTELETSTTPNSGHIEPEFILQSFYLSGNEKLITARLSLSINNLNYLRDILRDGARLSVECHSALYRERTFWRNEVLSEHLFSSSLKYNPLQRDFLIFSEGSPPIVNSDLSALLQATWGNLEMPLAELSRLEKDETYIAVVSLILKHEKMPPWLSKNVLFWSDIIIPTQEYQLEFEY